LRRNAGYVSIDAECVVRSKAWVVTLTESEGEYSAPTSVLAAIATVTKIPLKFARSTWNSQSSRITSKLLKTSNRAAFYPELGTASPNSPDFRRHISW
jgi:hypothetical protein